MLLEVGMKLYSDGRNHLTVSRVTKSRAYVKLNDVAEWKFDREVGDGKMIRRRGDSYRLRSYYTLETPELLAACNREILERKFSEIKVKSLSDEQLKAILAASNNGFNSTPPNGAAS